MNIKIVSQDKMEKENKRTSIIRNTSLIFFPNPKMLYQQRLARFESLEKNSPFSDYLQFCKKIVQSQAKLLEDYPLLFESNTKIILGDITPKSILNDNWIFYFTEILKNALNTNEVIDKTIKRLQSNDKKELFYKATLLLNGKFNEVDSNESLFLWSALMLSISQIASHLSGKGIAENSDHQTFCPVCQSHPVASTIHLGKNSGLRYLHCSLCESEWYLPRVKCTNCGNLENIVYYSLDEELSSTKTECCEKCHSYLKVFNQEQDPHLEIVADDIQSLLLDMETEKQGFAKSGINPFLFSSQ